MLCILWCYSMSAVVKRATGVDACSYLFVVPCWCEQFPYHASTREMPYTESLPALPGKFGAI